MAPELPAVTEWMRGGASDVAQMSLGRSEAAKRPGASGVAPSQLGTLQLAARTASLAGASIGQVFRQQRSSSEGTVQVVLARQAQSALIQVAPRDNPALQAASSVAVPVPNGAIFDRQLSVLLQEEHSVRADSMTAASKAAGADLPDIPDIDAEPSQANNNAGDAPSQEDKPTDSFSSAAAGAMQLTDTAAAAAAPSLVSHHTGPSCSKPTMGEEKPSLMDDDATLPPSVRDAPNNQSSAVAPAPCTSQLGDGTSVRRRPSVSAAVSRQLHSVVGAALARVAAPGPRPGNSCNSDNHRVIVGVKRKAATVGRPPMAPPQVARMAVVPSASSAGAAPLGGEPALTVEDAVSMVQQGLEMDAEVACDAVSTLSKASADGGVHGLVEVQGRLVVVHPGLSRASVGLSSRANA